MSNEVVTYVSDSSSEDSDVLCGPTTEKKRRPGICWICNDHVMDMVIHPCNHAVCCYDCFQTLEDPKVCPCCGRKVTVIDRFILA